MGCTKSHLGVLDRYIATQPTAGFAAVFEDDWSMTGTPEQLALARSVLEWPDCRVLLLAMNPLETEPTGAPGVVRVRKAMSTSAYLVRHDYAPVLRAVFQKALEAKRPLDVIWFELQAQGGFYALDPPLGVQAPSYSDIVNRNVNYGV